MLKIIVPSTELYDEEKNLFIYVKEAELVLEHSLASISKWEQKYKKPFLSKKSKTKNEFLDYIRDMTINDVDENIYYALSDSMLNRIYDYVESNATATWFKEEQNKTTNREIITSEVIYYWMFKRNIPLECDQWHLNRLLTLIRVFDAKEAPKKKLGNRELLRQNRELNEQRRKAWNTKG